jgi:hypothetical protein
MLATDHSDAVQRSGLLSWDYDHSSRNPFAQHSLQALG